MTEKRFEKVKKLKWLAGALWHRQVVLTDARLIPTLGYDLVGQEDLGYSWLYHDQVENMFQIVKDSGQKSPIHAGETNWGAGLNRMTNLNHVPQDANTFSPEKNLLTAIKYSDDQLVPRVGHGLALAHHPLWIESMRAKGQCVVVMALSNHMLQYVQ
uniref:Uncharacterized protein n=1 Tax=Plectus sambesii TaxID=2011161 RepID=A0A914UTL7_9BILA